MRRPSILDVVHAVKRTASGHPSVTAWWYAPPRRLPLGGERAEGAGEAHVEVVIELPEGGPDDGDRIAVELAQALRLPSVRVRPHRGEAEERRLFRLVSRSEPQPDGWVESRRPT